MAADRYARRLPNPQFAEGDPNDPENPESPNYDPYAQDPDAADVSSPQYAGVSADTAARPVATDPWMAVWNELVAGQNPVQSNWTAEPYRVAPTSTVGDIGAWGGLSQAAGLGLNEDRTAAMAATSQGAANLSYLDQAQRGQVPSAAELQTRAQLEQAQRAALAAAATGRGGGGQQRAAILAGQQTGLEAVMQGAAQRAQEQAQARDAYLSGLGLQGQLAANQAGISDQALNLLVGIQNQSTSWANADVQNALAAEQINAGIYDTAVGANTDIALGNLQTAAARDEARRERKNKFIDNTLGVVGRIGGMG